MRNITSVLFLILSVVVYAQPKTNKQPVPYSTKDKSITVYTSSDSTNLRITKTDKLVFTELKQPLETQIFVFCKSR